MRIRRIGQLIAVVIPLGVLLWVLQGGPLRLFDPLPNITLGEAASSGEDTQVRKALAAGAAVNGLGTGWTPLMMAVDGGHLSTIRLLLTSGAEVNQADSHGWTALHVSAKRGRTDVIELLLAQGAQLQAQTADGRSALQIAEAGSHQAAERLLKGWGNR